MRSRLHTSIAGLRQYAHRGFGHWMQRRIPAARSVTLNQRRIFILPSRAGLFFGVLLLVILLTAINYQNNMSYALAFLLATLFVVATLHTYANLAGLTLHALAATPAFPGQQSTFSLRLERGRLQAHYGLRLAWPDSGEATVNLVTTDSAEVHLYLPVGSRGWHHPGRLLLESTYPLGLLRCWTWVDLDLRAVVYPQPLVSPELVGAQGNRADGAAAAITGSDDFYGFREYRFGDSLRQVHWKGLAKGQALQSKDYASYASHSAWLDWELFHGVPPEQRLSHLCYWALAFHRRNEDYGLRIPGLRIDPARGDVHLDRVLSALALYGHEQPVL
ncbi:DUF58 domain-containing protein [Kineobactrum sediminis]|uniref:DUF58 domain-containing protein n=1 Tax=Kineobactrum sediminis TaxID=1905677 RepID=A0A2N5Y310_9GAMM|nr:DUF58 domain-containing protein [Kineobactrum sediminis]PLW82739.1 DUF58 domain-containing protein [Kineobactrum sediminis]